MMTHPDPRSQYSHHYPQAYPPRRSVNEEVPPPWSADSRTPLPSPGYPPVAASPRRPVRKAQGALLAGSLAGSGMLALAAVLAISPDPPLDRQTTAQNSVCQEKVASQSVLSRAELSELLTVPERSPRAAVRQLLDEPYCTLSPIQLREGAIAEREAYPLEFDPQTWFIVLYEAEEYAGYDFSFQRQ